jgi:hypothetical protein
MAKQIDKKPVVEEPVVEDPIDLAIKDSMELLSSIPEKGTLVVVYIFGGGYFLGRIKDKEPVGDGTIQVHMQNCNRIFRFGAKSIEEFAAVEQSHYNDCVFLKVEGELSFVAGIPVILPVSKQVEKALKKIRPDLV